jgi:hypothetical protein
VIVTKNRLLDIISQTDDREYVRALMKAGASALGLQLTNFNWSGKMSAGAGMEKNKIPEMLVDMVKGK